MKITLHKLNWMAAGSAFALFAGTPALADDTELFLLGPDPTKLPKANVLFILDTSGSMTTTQSTNKPYDSALTYTGDCDATKYYWTDVDVTPDCTTTTNVINGDAFKCDFASRQIAGIGSFTNTMVQYRDGGADGTTGSTDKTWQYLASGFPEALVECQADGGKHGDGTSETRLWPGAGTNLTEPFVDVATEAVSWGSAPRNRSYTVFSGNYLNWKATPEVVTLSRSDIMKEVTKKVLSSVNNLNVGLMRFVGSDGGSIILDIQDLDANRTTVIDTVSGLPADGNTPLSETLYEAALFWTGQNANYGSTAKTTLTDSNTFVAGSDPEKYEQPAWDVCSKNYNVLLSDGDPVNDVDTPGLLTNLPDWATTMGSTSCDGDITQDGACLDDVGKYLSIRDIDPVADGDQFVTTHTIGFVNNIASLEETAADSGGQYFLANDVETLTKTLLSIIANINDRSLSFSAPAVSVNTFNRTRNLNDLYITMFGARGRAHWPGNLKKYRLVNQVITDADNNAAVDATTGFFADSARSYWTVGTDGNNVQQGGAANKLPDPATRKLYTNLSSNIITATGNHVSVANKDSFTPADLGLTGAAEEPTKENLIRWARGEDIRDEDDNLATTVRNVMGDPLHSQPAAVVYGGSAADPNVVVFTATNDGYLHAIDGKTGVELWSFIPKELLGNLTRLYFDPRSTYKQYGIDGNVVPAVADRDGDGIIEPGDGDFVYIIFGLRRGGDKMYAMDVTNLATPKVLWDVSLSNAGQSWSTPAIARVSIDPDEVTQNADKAVVIVGGGYDAVHDTSAHPATADGVGAGIHMLDLATGATLWRAGPTTETTANLKLATMTRSMPNAIRVVDLNGDRFADRMYASDMGGQVWRFDLFNGQGVASLVTGGVIARVGAEGLATPTAADTRRFYNSPDVSLITDRQQQRSFIAVSLGSGYRAHPFDLTAADRFFSIRDPYVYKKLTQDEYNTFPIITDSNLVEVSGKKQTVITASDGGWKFTLPNNQKILSDSLTFNDEIFFVAFSPDSNAAATCTAGQGTNFLYRVQVLNGDPVTSNLEALDPADADDARRKTLQQGGIAPSPTMLFPSPDDPATCTGDECSPPPLGCVGVECFNPGFENFPVRTLWTQDGVE